MKTLTLDTVGEVLRAQEGKIFTVTFIKRTNGERRVMNCRLGVKAYLAGGEPAYDFVAKNLLPVYDVKKNGYRSIPLDAVEGIKAEGQTYKIVR